jgi:mannose-6-phosphate isomerase-like protein (cupin superfamily)
MTMRVTKLDDAEPFQPVDHDGVGPVRLQGGETMPTDKFSVVLSHYLPGAKAKLAPQPAETVYVLTSGELVMSADGVEETLGVFDSVHFTAGTVRSVENRTHLPATMLVIRATS